MIRERSRYIAYEAYASVVGAYKGSLHGTSLETTKGKDLQHNANAARLSRLRTFALTTKSHHIDYFALFLSCGSQKRRP